MNVLRVASSSLQFIKARITASVAGAVVDPTQDAVKVAFVTSGVTPQTADFHTGSWETDAVSSPKQYYAMCLVGPTGTVQLTAGLYHMWVQITDNPETPVLWAGIVKVV